MVFLEDNNKQETLLEKIKECDNDMAFDQFINVSNNTYDHWDLFSAVLCCKAWVLLNYINNDEILSQMIVNDIANSMFELLIRYGCTDYKFLKKNENFLQISKNILKVLSCLNCFQFFTIMKNI